MNLASLERRLEILESKLCCGKPVFKDTFDDFPDEGLANTLYVDEETFTIYMWDVITEAYIITNPQEVQPLVYKVLLSQRNIDAPTPIILKNTLGNIIWEYRSVGTYRGQLTGAFTNNKTFILANHSSNLSGETNLLGTRLDGDFIEITNYASGVLQDEFTNANFLIEVYP